METFFALNIPLVYKIILGGIFGLLIVWTLGIKGYALWVAAQRRQTAWFAIILIANTLGILELVYLLLIAKVRQQGEGVAVAKVTSTPAPMTIQAPTAPVSSVPPQQ